MSKDGCHHSSMPRPDRLLCDDCDDCDEDDENDDYDDQDAGSAEEPSLLDSL